MNISLLSATFGALSPGDKFYSHRTGDRCCAKLDQPYLRKWDKSEVNTFVTNDEFGLSTLAYFDDSEKVSAVRESKEAEISTSEFVADSA